MFKQVENLYKGALQQFQFESKLLNRTFTPNAALLKFQSSVNFTIEQVLWRRSEFLTTHKLNVISVRAEPGIVAIATYGKAFSISAPSPSMRWVLVDEDAASLDDATFVVGMECLAWVDVPGTYHNGGCGFAFADGHLETHHCAIVR